MWRRRGLLKKSDLVKMGLYLESLTQKEGRASELASSDERKKKARRAVASPGPDAPE